MSEEPQPQPQGGEPQGGTALGQGNQSPPADPSPAPADAGSQGSALSAGVPDSGGEAPWYSGLLSEETLQDEKVKSFAEKYKSVEEAIKGAGHLQSKIGEKGVKIPGEGADPSEWSSVYNALGRPEEAAGYDWEPPEGVQIEEETFNKTKERLHGMGLTNDQFKEVMSMYTEHMQGQAQATEEQFKQRAEEATKTLKERWGSDYNKNLAAANKFAESAGIVEYLEQTGLANEPGLIEMLANIQKTIGEDSLNAPTDMVSAKEQAADLRKIVNDLPKGHPDRRRALEKLVALQAPPVAQ